MEELCLKKLKVFSTSNKKIHITQNEINEWIEQEKIEVYQMSITNGVTHSNETEIFIVIIYSK